MSDLPESLPAWYVILQRDAGHMGMTVGYSHILACLPIDAMRQEDLNAANELYRQMYQNVGAYGIEARIIAREPANPFREAAASTGGPEDPMETRWRDENRTEVELPETANDEWSDLR